MPAPIGCRHSRQKRTHRLAPLRPGDELLGAGGSAVAQVQQYEGIMQKRVYAALACLAASLAACGGANTASVEQRVVASLPSVTVAGVTATSPVLRPMTAIVVSATVMAT